MTRKNRLGDLYICATPIGNLSDISTRLIETLRSVTLVAAEDTRVTKKLLDHLNLSTALLSVDQHKEAYQCPKLYEHLSSGQDAALVSDAGTPCLSDPGAYTITTLRDKGVRIIPIPGPCAVSTLLSASGFSEQGFYFGGFLPRKSGELTSKLQLLETVQVPLVFFESPKRLLSSLDTLLTIWPDCKVAVGKELTKTFETILVGPLTEIREQLDTVTVKGEWTVAILPPALSKDNGPDPKTIQSFLDKGFKASDLKKIAGVLGWPKNAVYDLAIELSND